ncbi:hypothetical protein K8T06_18145 [bacterium]|nr:hypothetical protein [bacterium]
MRGILVTLTLIFTCIVSYGAELGDLMREMGELKQRRAALEEPLEMKFQDVLPDGKQSYGEFIWTCNYSGSFI